MVFKRVQLDLEAEPPGKNLFTPWAQKLPSHAGTASSCLCFMFGRDVAYGKLFGKETNTSNANEKSPNITLCSTMKKEKSQQLYN